ncbi:monooxygenase [Enemella evansiae]|nr:monooxygenase [Enemella evansiae]
MTALATRPISHPGGESVVEPGTMRQVLGHYPTGVSVVTALGADQCPVGLTIGTFNSVSLDPPLVAFYPMRSSRSFTEIRAHGAFVVNVLGSRQDYYCRAFARDRDQRFAGIDWTPGRSGAPVLTAAAAWIDCTIERIEEAGDHYWVLGRVQALDIGTGEEPLVFFKGGYGRPSDLSDPRSRWHVDVDLPEES